VQKGKGKFAFFSRGEEKKSLIFLGSIKGKEKRGARKREKRYFNLLSLSREGGGGKKGGEGGNLYVL